MFGGDDDEYYSEEGGFQYYEITTQDPGPWLLVGTLLFSIGLYCLLPFLVACGKRRERRRLQRQQHEAQGQHEGTAPMDSFQQHTSQKFSAAAANATMNDENSNSPSSRPIPSRTASAQQRQFQQQFHRDPYDSTSHHRRHHNRGDTDNADNVSVASSRSSTSAFITDVIAGATQAKNMGRRRKHMEKRLQRIEDVSENNFSVEITSPPPPPRNQQREQGSGGTGGATSSESESGVVGGKDKLSTFEEVSSFGNAMQGFDSGRDTDKNHDHDHHPEKTKSIDVSMRFSKKNHRMPRLARAWDNLLQVVEWDYENKRIMKLAGPYIIQALVAGIAEATRVAIIGRFYGTRELSAYVIVDALVGLSTGVVGGITDSAGVMCSQSIGAGQTKLTGQYVQIGIIVFVIVAVPCSIMWTFAMGPILDFMGFDALTVQMGFEFTKIFVWSEAICGIEEGILAFLDITGHEIFGTVFAVIDEVSITVMMLLLSLLSKDPPTLTDVGYLMLVVKSIYTIILVLIVLGMRWWRKYYSGMVYSCAISNYNATKAVVTTAIPLSFGYLLAYGEWEILTFFAAWLGPAEVAAWGVLGSVWDVLEETTEAVAEAGEVRCAFLLGAGRPYHAAMSAAKSTVFAFVFSILLTCIVLICGDNLAVWMTSDPTLQKLVSDLIPLFGLGNVTLTIGTMAWTLVGAQGRYALSTTVGFFGSWCVTLPLAAIFTFVLGVSLEGQTAAVVIGYMVSGTWNTYYLLMSDWKAISEKVVAYNLENGVDLDSDQESSSNSDDSSSISSAEDE